MGEPAGLCYRLQLVSGLHLLQVKVGNQQGYITVGVGAAVEVSSNNSSAISQIYQCFR